MKKIIVILFMVMVIAVFINEKKALIIPNDAIRFRVIANSNEIIDQQLKLAIKDDVQKELYNIIGNTKDINVVREKISNNLDKIDNILKEYDVSYEMSFGNNYFPLKEYKGVNYPAGNYESLVITLGNGEGHNWWCVLFPPLCLLDEKEDLENAKYELYVKKIINIFK